MSDEEKPPSPSADKPEPPPSEPAHEDAAASKRGSIGSEHPPSEAQEHPPEAQSKRGSIGPEHPTEAQSKRGSIGSEHPPEAQSKRGSIGPEHPTEAQSKRGSIGSEHPPEAQSKRGSIGPEHPTEAQSKRGSIGSEHPPEAQSKRGSIGSGQGHPGGPPGPLAKEEEGGAEGGLLPLGAEAEGEKRKSIEGDEKSKRGSLPKPDDAKSVVPTLGKDGDLTTTLQELFTYQSHSAENVAAKPLRRPKLVFENSFQLESSKPFSATRSEALIKRTLEEMLENVRYNSKTVNNICAQVAEKIRSRLLSYRYDRYKLIIIVTIGSKTRQGVHQGFRNLWDPARDSYAHGSFMNLSIFACACVYAIYFE